MSTPKSPQDDYALRVSDYDRVSSMVLSMVILLAIFVFILFVIWLTSQIFLRHAAVPVQMVELGDSESPLGGGDELEDLEDWGMESELTTPQLPETLASIADAVGPQTAMLDNPRLTGADQAGGTGDGRMPAGKGGGTGIGRVWEFRFPRVGICGCELQAAHVACNVGDWRNDASSSWTIIAFSARAFF